MVEARERRARGSAKVDAEDVDREIGHKVSQRSRTLNPCASIPNALLNFDQKMGASSHGAILRIACCRSWQIAA